MTQKFSSLIDLLKHEPKIVINKIYSAEQTSQWSCQAIFQALSPLSRILIFRLLFLHASFKLNDIYLMIGKATEEDIEQVFDELLGLDILTEEVSSDSTSKTTNKSLPSDLIDLTSGIKPPAKQSKYQSDPNLYRMNTSFQKNLLRAITQPTDPWEDLRSGPGGKPMIKISVSTEMIEEYRVNQWNKVLSYLLGIVPDSAFAASPLIPTFMKNFGLMMKAPTTAPSHILPTTSSNSMVITAKGYEFLLKDYYHQVWDYVSIALTHVNKEENLSLLFMLSSTAFGQSYPMESLTQSQRIFLFELSQVGIVYLPDSVNSKYFFPTKTIINLLFGMYNPSVLVGSISGVVGDKSKQPTGSEEVAGQFSSPILNGSSTIATTTQNNHLPATLDDHQHQLQIIVETNLQVTAYVTNDLHVALLQLFVDIHIRFANMAIGRITRDKSIKAFKIGMKAAQMIDFLLIHAHPLTKKRVQIIPENVIDQLILWESELYRITPTESQLYDFTKLLQTKPTIYQRLLQQLRSSNLILWESPHQFVFVSDAAAEPIIQNFLQQSYQQLF